MESFYKSKLVKVVIFVFVAFVSLNVSTMSADDVMVLEGADYGIGDMNLGMSMVEDEQSIEGDPTAPYDDDNSFTAPEIEYPDVGVSLFLGTIIYSCDGFLQNVLDDELGYLFYGSNLTNQNVTVTLIGLDSDVIITNNGGSNVYVYTEDGQFAFEVEKTSTGETYSFDTFVDFINKETPTAVLSYTTVDETVVASIDTYSLEGKIIEVLNNDGAYEYTFSDNGEFTFEYIDAYGNTGTTTAVVSSFGSDDDASSTDPEESQEVTNGDESGDLAALEDDSSDDEDDLLSGDDEELSSQEEEKTDDESVQSQTTTDSLDTPYTSDTTTYSYVFSLMIFGFVSLLLMYRYRYGIINK